MFKSFGCNVGDKLYVASIKERRIFEFIPDCLKVFDSDYTAHGYVYGKYGNWGTPTEYSLKNLNKRVIFTQKKNAKKWLNNQIEPLKSDLGKDN